MAGQAISNVYVWAGHSNGQVDYSAMVRLDDVPGNWFANDSMYAHPETAARVRWIYAECQRRGLKSVRPNECYRDLGTQQFWKTYWTNQGKPGNAATPGGSPHGFGYACDWDFSPADESGFYTVCAEAGMLFNISGEDWHNAPLANATVNLDPETEEDPMAAFTAEDLNNIFANVLRAPEFDVGDMSKQIDKMAKQLENLRALPSTQAGFRDLITGQINALLGRVPTDQEYANYLNQLNDGTEADLINAIKDTDEYKRLHP